MAYGEGSSWLDDEWGGDPFPAGESGGNDWGEGAFGTAKDPNEISSRLESPRSSYPLPYGGQQSRLSGTKTAIGPGGVPAGPSNSLGSKGFFVPSGYQTSYERKILPNMPAPALGPLPELKLPEWDPKAIEAKTQAAAAPSLRRLRSQMREAQGKYYENPNVKRMTLRDAMAGYGLGLENAMAGAKKEALQEYSAEYAPKMTAAQTQYQADLQKQMTNYQAAWQDYNNRIANTRTTIG